MQNKKKRFSPSPFRVRWWAYDAICSNVVIKENNTEQYLRYLFNFHVLIEIVSLTCFDVDSDCLHFSGIFFISPALREKELQT